MTASLSNGSFQALADEMPSLVFCADLDGRAVYCNRKLQEFTGLSQAALLGGAWLLAVHEEDRACAQSAWRQAIATHEPYEVEYRLRAADGHYRWFLIRCVPAGASGRAEHWVGVGIDIHDRKLIEENDHVEYERTQDALSISEARYRTIFQSMFNIVGILDTDGVLLEANDAALAFGGVAAAEVVGRKFWDTPWWDVGEEARLQLRGAIAAAAAGQFVRYEASVRTTGKCCAIIDFTLKPVVDDLGAVRQIIAEGRDLTIIKAVEKELRESQARVQRIVDSGIIGVGYGNVHGVVSDVNDAFLHMIGETRSNFVAGRINWRALTAPEYSDRDEHAIAQLERNGACEPYEKEYVLPGRRLPVQIAMAKVESTTPDIDHVALIVDLTAQKQAQAALAASHAELERRVVERTAELRQANERLVQEMTRREALQGALLQSQKLEALGQLTSSVAHDFNNVLAAIMGGFELIRKRTDEKRLQKLATDGTKAAERGAELIRKLLAFARQQNAVSQRVELHTFFDELSPQLRHLAGRSAELIIGDALGLPAVEIDPGQLNAAVTNLIVNARDALPDGGQIAIHFQEIAIDDREKPREIGDVAAVAIHVTDNGTGMSPPVLQRVLEPFFTTKAPGKGTGLGLAMVHSLMMQSGGALRIESLVGNGTTVSLFLPISNKEPAPSAGIGQRELRVHSGGRVLLVEDDGLVRDVVTSQLADMGYRVVQSDSAADAMITVNDGEPLLCMVTDHALAGSNGLDLVAEVRGIRPMLPVLFITGHADPKGVEHETVLLKPFLPEALSKSVLDVVERSSGHGERDASLDRLAARFKSGMLDRMLARWRNARRGRHLPPLKHVAVTWEEVDFIAYVAVDQTHVPMTFELTQVGAELRRRAPADFSGGQLEVTGETAETSQEGAYRRCVRSKRPTYDFARFDFGEEGGSSFERLLLPCSDDGSTVTGLIAVINFD